MPILCVQTPTPALRRECSVDRLVSDICLRFSPPIPLLPLVINKCNQSQMTLILITAQWARQTWFSDLMGMAQNSMQRLPGIQHLLSMQWGKSSTSRAKNPELSRLAPQDIEFGHLVLPGKTMAILRGARRATTRKCYTAKWERWPQI